MNSPSPVPHLQTALNGPLLALETQLLARQNDIEAWFRQQWHTATPPFYASVDLRNAGFKLAPVDTNLFPAGFNNLAPAFEPLCIHAIQSAMEKACPMAKGLLLVPENHTRNTYYLENLASLASYIQRAGYNLRIASLSSEITEATSFDLPSGKSIMLEPLRRDGDKVGVEDFFPCAVLLNNDLSSGMPEILENIEQPVLPPLALGWTKRLKTGHFGEYRKVAAEFAEMVGLDPWLIDPLFRNCGQINFKEREGEECLHVQVDTLLKEIQQKYDEYGIEQEPFVVVKSDSGTYGMGIMVARSADEVMQLNRKQRNKMASAKEGNTSNSVIIQEGVHTLETVPADGVDAVAEPVVYMIDQWVVGGFYRVHTGRGATDNLNAPGAHFRPLAFADSCSAPDSSQSPDSKPNRFYAYGVIARLALVAASREIEPHASAHIQQLDAASHATSGSA